jgi:hypothetical protein
VFLLRFLNLAKSRNRKGFFNPLILWQNKNFAALSLCGANRYIISQSREIAKVFLIILNLWQNKNFAALSLCGANRYIISQSSEIAKVFLILLICGKIKTLQL